MESKEKYRLLFENTKDTVFVTTPDGRFIDINPAGVELFGYESREEMLRLDIGKDIYSDPNERKRFQQELEKNGYLKDFRLELKRKDGKTLIVLATANAVRNDTGEIVAYQGIHRDITVSEQQNEVLLEELERLDLALKSANMGIWYWDVAGKKIFFDEQSLRIFGIDPSTFTGTIDEYYKVVYPEDRALVRSNLYRSLTEKESGLCRDEYRILRPDGSTRYITGRWKVVRDNTGRPSRLHGIHWDVTDRRRAEDALKETNELLRVIIDTAPMAIIGLDLEGKVQTVWNRAAEKLLGWSADEAMGRHLPSVPFEKEGEFRQLREMIKNGKTLDGVEAHRQKRDGSRIDYDIYGSPLRDRNGNISGHIAVLVDITERKRMMEALRESEERFKRLLHNSNDIIALLDEKSVQTFISGPIEKILGYKAEEWTGKPIFDLIHPDDAENAKKAFSEIVRQPGSSRTIEFRMRHISGKWVSVEGVGSNLLRDPVVNSVVANIRDISERTRFREQLQQAMKMEAVGRLAGGIAHDFNNILTVISGNLELARMSLNPADPLNRSLDQASRAADSAASLTRQLLAFSRKQIIEPRVLNLDDLVRNLQPMLARLIGEHVTLQTVPCGDLGSVKVDPGQFEQVLVNLAVNARDAMPEGGTLVIETANVALDERYCATHSQSQPGDFVLLAVSDTGHGMSDKVKEHLFEPFFTTKGKGLGTGLGLATTFGVVRQAGGTIEAYTEEGRGTTFKIYLPRVGKRAEKLVKAELPLDLMKGDETILLVEDESNVREVAFTILKELGYRVIEARNGEEAMTLADGYAGEIDLLMTDIVMPGLNGRELSERLARRRPGMKTLFTSGYTENVIVHHGILDSHLNFIGKPYALRTLAGKIREVLKPGTSAAD
ncbi:MAG: PAS domain S-box protein [Deltaproteobacteria bacterium]|nr:PAS domain S-box protein [Deltaproteobacteria bacterium]